MAYEPTNPPRKTNQSTVFALTELLLVVVGNATVDITLPDAEQQAKSGKTKRLINKTGVKQKLWGAIVNSAEPVVLPPYTYVDITASPDDANNDHNYSYSVSMPQAVSQRGMTFKNPDGSTVAQISTLIVEGGTVTDNGDGTATLRMNPITGVSDE